LNEKNVEKQKFLNINSLNLVASLLAAEETVAEFFLSGAADV
jgi:hypothetical protein